MRLLRHAGLAVIATALIAQIAVAGLTAFASRTGHTFLIITGGSMEPTYSVGDALLLRDRAPRTVTAGDVVTFRAPNQVLTTHRVLVTHRIDGARFIQTQGDANALPDPDFTPATAVIGSPVGAIPHGGQVASWLMSSWGRFFTYAPPLFLLLLTEVRLLLVGWVAWRRERHRSQAVTGEHGHPGRPWSVVCVVVVLAMSATAGVMLNRSTALFVTSAASEVSTVRTVGLLPPPAVTATKSGNKVTVMWASSTSPRMDRYNVYRRTGSASNPFVLVASPPVTQNSYVDANTNGSAAYLVRAAVGPWESADSAIASP